VSELPQADPPTVADLPAIEAWLTWADGALSRRHAAWLAAELAGTATPAQRAVLDELEDRYARLTALADALRGLAREAP
jgi:hypothetical protein